MSSTILLVNVLGLVFGRLAGHLVTIPIAHVAHGKAATMALPDLGRLLATVVASPDHGAVAFVQFADVLVAGTVLLAVPIVGTGVGRLVCGVSLEETMQCSARLKSDSPRCCLPSLSCLFCFEVFTLFRFLSKAGNF